jgi:hypothetical protein
MRRSVYIPPAIITIFTVLFIGIYPANAFYSLIKHPDKYCDTGVRIYDASETVCKIKRKCSTYIYNDLEISFKGLIRVSDDDRDIKSISPGGYLIISSKTFGNKREVNIVSDSDGKLKKEYYVGRNKREWEPEGRKWLAENLLEVLRSTGIDAEGRTSRIYKQEGVDGVISEIAHINSNSVMLKYFEALLETEGLSDNEKCEVIEEVCNRMTSNTNISRFLRKYDEVYMKNNKLARSYFNCVSQLTSNTETSLVLRHVMKHNELSKEMMIYLLNCVDYMTSNTEMSIVLRAFNNSFPDDQTVSDAYFNAIDNMTSNTSISAVLIDLMDNQKLRDYDMNKLLIVTSHMTSNTSMASVLKKFNFHFKNDNIVSNTYFRTLSAFTSNTDMSSVMRDLLNKQQLSDNSMIKYLRAARYFTSNTDMGSVLKKAIPYLNLNNELVMTEFFKTVEGFTSNTEMGSVLRRLIDREKPNDNNIKQILLICRYFTSNTEMENVMVKLSYFIDEDDKEIRDMYIDTAKSLSSQTSYRNVMEALLD